MSSISVEPVSIADGEESSHGSPCVAVRKLTYAYPDGTQALREVTFALQPGERVALAGPSGAGKSTLLRHLNGLLPLSFEREPRPGIAVSVAGKAVSKTTLPEIRRQVGLLFQDPDDQLICATVGQDVAFGPRNLGVATETITDLVAQSLDAVGLRGFENRATLQLSFGERKRVCLAGLLACRPEILVLDEPFSNLDPRSRRALRGILERFEGTLLIATHELDLVLGLCPRILILDQGSIQADGHTLSLLSDPVLMERHGLEVPAALSVCDPCRTKLLKTPESRS